MKAIFNAGKENARIAAMKLLQWAAEREMPVMSILESIHEGRIVHNGSHCEQLTVDIRPDRYFVQYCTSGTSWVSVFFNKRAAYIIMGGSSFNIMRRGSLINRMWYMRWGGDLKLYSTWGPKLQDILEAAGQTPYAHTVYFRIEADYHREEEP